MRKTMLKTMGGVALTILLALTLSQIRVAGQIKADPTLDVTEFELKSEQSKLGNGLVGTWLVQVTVRNCATGVPLASFPSLLTYAEGGTLISSTSSVRPALSYPGQGVWEYVGGQQYTGSYMFFRFNPDGTFAGTQKIVQEIDYDRHADQLSITATFEVFDVGGNVIGTGCVTATGTRFQ
jgi:hypothetical protein